MCEQGRQNWRDNEMHSDYPPLKPTTNQNEVRIALNDGYHMSDCIDGRNPACSGCVRLETIQLSSLAFWFCVLKLEMRSMRSSDKREYEESVNLDMVYPQLSRLMGGSLLKYKATKPL